MDTPGQRLKALRVAHGFATAKEAALAIGVPVATYTMHEAADKALPARRAEEYARIWHSTPEWLMFGRIAETEPLNHIQLIDNGATIHMPPPLSHATRAIQVRPEDGLGEFTGWFALFDLPQNPSPKPAHDCIGRLCVAAVRADHGHVYLLRRLLTAASPGLYHLIGGPAPLMDHAIVWATPIHSIVPPNSGVRLIDTTRGRVTGAR